ncbi:MAG: PQQ-binding-like beta-propeller repeat protein [bacterium]|nr:PQQ-binding-like beta-propeller repeat protein [bacterium]
MRPLLMLRLLALGAGLVLVGCGSSDGGASWPQWRGPGGLGISSAEELPVHWDSNGEGIKWSARIDGTGTSSPIAVGDRVILTSAKAVGNRVELQVHSFDLNSGESLWQTTVARRKREKMHRMNSSAGPTPVSDGHHTFAYFGSHLAALDAGGKPVWVNEIDPAYLKEARYAAGSSLILAGDLVIVLRDRERVAEELVGWITAYDKATGELVWKNQWDDSCCSYVTPLAIGGGSESEAAELFVVLAGYVVSFDPKTGEALRREDQVIAQPVASPVVEDDLICVASGAHAHRQARCWEVVEEGGKTSWKLLWEISKWVPDTSSPILLNGRLYLLTEKGILRCLDARTGKMLWQKRLERSGYRASLLAGAGKLYATGETGAVSVISLDDGQTIAVNYLPEARYVASPAVAGECLLIRSASELHCVNGTDGPSQSEAA